VGGRARAVQARLDLFEKTGDPACLLELQAFEELAALRTQISWSAYDPPPPAAQIQHELDVIVLAGTFSWARSHELPAVDRLEALLEATELFCAVYPLPPGSVPASAAGVCAAISSTGGQNRADLDEAIQVSREGVDSTAADDPARAARLADLPQVLLERFVRFWQVADLDEAFAAPAAAARTARTAPADHPARGRCLSAVALAHARRFYRTGELRDVDEAIAAGRQAVDAADWAIGVLDRETIGGDHSLRPVYFAALGNAWRARFDATGDDGALRNAIICFEMAADAAPGEDPRRAENPTSLGAAAQAPPLVPQYSPCARNTAASHRYGPLRHLGP
jgi:hypothetical protein